MNIPFVVREQLVHGRSFVYRNRAEWNFVIRDVDVPGDAARGAKVAITGMLPAEYQLVTVSLLDRAHGIVTVRAKVLGKPSDAPEQPGKIMKPAARGLAKQRNSSR